jgi:hypothetical protein
MKKISILLAFLMCVSIVFSDDDIQPGKKKHGIGAGKNTATTVKDDESTSNTTQSKITKPKEKPTERTKTSSPIDTTSIEKSDSSLIVTPTENSKECTYYAHIVKRHGWYVGVGESISLKFANHLPFYYKLSRKNRAGQWTFIEALDGYGNPTTTHDCNTYVTELGTGRYYRSYSHLNENLNEKLNESWTTAVKSVCKWELIADPSGKEVTQERMLNSNGNFLFAFNPCKISDREYTGNYTDELGREISLLGSTFPNYAHIFLNKDGYEERINYTNRNGYVLKDTKNFVYGVQKEYDAQGRQTKEVYLNILGEPMLNYMGQAGWERVYEKEYYDHYFIDENGKRTKEYGFSSDTVLCGYRYYLDQYGRDTLSVSIDKNGKIYEKLNGCSRDKTSYNNHGRIIYSGKINKEGHPCSFSTTMYEYDRFGNEISFKMIDNNGQPTNNANGYHKCVSKYDSEGKTLIKQIKYKVDENSNSDSIKIYEYTRDKKGNIAQVWYDENYQRLDSVDNKGRTICIRYYDLNKQPINNPEDSTHLWSCKKTLYNDINNHITYKWYDKDNQPYLLYGSYSKLTYFQNTDTKTHIATTKYLIEDILYEYYQSQYNEEETKVISQWHLTNSDEHARVGWFNKLLYKDVFDYTIYNRKRAEHGINEFNEPSYIMNIGDNSYEEVYYILETNNGNDTYYDEDGEQIPDSTMSDFKASLPKAFCIEVTDTSVAYPLGLRNGDIIISYGDWTTTEDLRSNIYYLYLETILKAKEKKQITVMRHFPEQKKSKIFHYVLPEGRTSDLGFYPHMIYYTQKEKQRLLQTCAANSVSLPSLDSTERNHAVIMGVQLKGGFYETRLYHYPAYDIKDPGIVLYGKEKWHERIDTWSAIDGVEDWNNIGGLFYIENSNLWITQDLETYRHIFKSEQGYFGMHLIKVFVDSDTRKGIESLLIDNANEIGGEELVTDIKQKRGLITKEELIGNWTYREVGNDTSSLRIDIDLQENNKALLTFRKQFEMELNSDLKVNVDFTIKFKGMTWDIQDRTLALDTSQLTHSFKFNSVEFLGENEDSVRLYNKEMNTFKKEFIKEIKDDNNLFIKLFEDSNFEITCFKEDIMYFEEFTYPLFRLDKRKK